MLISNQLLTHFQPIKTLACGIEDKHALLVHWNSLSMTIENYLKTFIDLIQFWGEFEHNRSRS